MRCILDTTVLVAGLREGSGASFQLLTVPLVLGYEDVLTRPGVVPELSRASTAAFVDYLCQAGLLIRVHYLWRPQLSDARDDLVLEAAVTGQAPHVVTFDGGDFAGSERSGVSIVTLGDFLRRLRQQGRLYAYPLFYTRDRHKGNDEHSAFQDSARAAARAGRAGRDIDQPTCSDGRGRARRRGLFRRARCTGRPGGLRRRARGRGD